MHPPESFEERIRLALGPMLTNMMTQRGEKLPPDYAQKMQRVLREAMPYTELASLMADAYAKRLTLDELGQITSFYKSQAGQKLISIEPQVSGEMMQTVMGSMLPRMKQAMEKEGLLSPEHNRRPKQ
jgi:hypothetical protein